MGALPYPEPTSPAASRVMRGNRKRDTRPEMRLRSELHRRGLRFRKDYLIREDAMRVRADIAFPRSRLVVFVDGCFWHSCPAHGSVPRANEGYWSAKLERNRQRDKLVDMYLRSADWTVVRVWEHVDPVEAASLIEARLREISEQLSLRACSVEVRKLNELLLAPRREGVAIRSVKVGVRAPD